MEKFDWKNLPFGYYKTNYNVRSCWKDGKWSKLEVTDSEYINLHMAATCLHYGQECFEGLKAYRGKDGKVRLFRWQENYKRMARTADYILMQCPPEELFREAIFTAIKQNAAYIPPYGTGATLYIRPLLIGSGPQVGVKPSQEYLFIVFVTPVWPYFKEGFKPVDVWICREYDRAAPLGTGNIKVGGNYAASLIPADIAHKNGFAAALYLDPREKKYIDECGPANFIAIKNNTYITPKSNSILPSITNKSLMTLAEEIGMKVEVRPVPIEELETFEEVGMVGTAAVLSPIKRIVDTNKIYTYGKNNEPGKKCTELYNKLRAIQYGDIEDKHNWVLVL